METENEVLELIEMLYTMVTEAWGVPLGNEKCIVERDKVLNLLDEIKSRLPGEIAEAKRLVASRDDYINSAKREAESIRRAAAGRRLPASTTPACNPRQVSIDENRERISGGFSIPHKILWGVFLFRQYIVPVIRL